MFTCSAVCPYWNKALSVSCKAKTRKRFFAKEHHRLILGFPAAVITPNDFTHLRKPHHCRVHSPDFSSELFPGLVCKLWERQLGWSAGERQLPAHALSTSELFRLPDEQYLSSGTN